MTQSNPMLPAPFSDLESFAQDWALPSFNQRLQKRASSDMESLRAFYDAVQPRADAALEYLEDFDLDALPPPQLNLLRLLYALTQVCMAVEMHGVPKVPHASLPIPVRVLREPAPY
tara:strand:+ start:4245 stop:4592 length:348 start_codon:yes stop_codon:yes gene_type:complete